MHQSFLGWVVAQAMHNQFFSGAAMAGILGVLVVELRSIPGRIWNALVDQFTVHLTVHGEDNIAPLLDFWLGQHKWIKRSRKLGITEKWVDTGNSGYDPDEGMYNRRKPQFHLTAGPGTHFIWYDGKLIKIHRVEKENDASHSTGNGRTITTTMAMLGRSRATFDKLLCEAAASEDEDTRVAVYAWQTSRFQIIDRRKPREFNTLFMDPNIKADIMLDAKNFLRKELWYSDRGIPYRRGYMLEGVPGGGKSSTIFALASALNLPIYVINAGSMTSDSALEDAFQSAGRGLVVIEDLDALAAGESREIVKGKDKGDANKKMGISLSGLLNAIDGVAAKEGRILIVTSNHPENLDPALMRPGRIDRRWHMGLLDENLAREMCEHFLGGDKHFYDNHVAEKMPLSPAALQGILLEHVS